MGLIADDDRDILMKFNQINGKLVIETKIESHKSSTVVFTKDGADFNVDFDSDGKAEIQFTKGPIAIMHRMKIKDKTGIEKDKRMAFSY